MRMFLCGEWQDAQDSLPVRNPYTGQEIDTVPRATPQDVDRALHSLQAGARVMRAMSALERSQILRKTVQLMREREEDLARTISSEEGKVLSEGRL